MGILSQRDVCIHYNTAQQQEARIRDTCNLIHINGIDGKGLIVNRSETILIALRNQWPDAAELGYSLNTYSKAECKFTRARRTNEAMKESLDKYLQKLYPEMPNTEKAAIYHYTSAYRQLNKQLRDGKLSEFNEAFSELLSNALQKLPPMEATVYRTIRLNKTRLRAFTEMAMNGAETTFAGFTSTTLDRSIAELFAANHKGIKKNETDVLLVISGKSGRSIEDFSQFGVRYHKPNQREVLFDKGMNVRFDRVVQEDGTFVFYITEL